MRCRLSTSSTPPLLLYCFSGVGSSRWLMFFGGSVRTAFARAGGMPCAEGGSRFVVSALAAPCVPLSLGSTGFVVTGTDFTSGFLMLWALNDFVGQVMVARTDSGLRGCANWLREDLGARPHAWLRADFVPPSPFHVTKDKVAKTSQIDAEFRKAWMPYICRSRHPVVAVEHFLNFVDPFLPQEPVLDLLGITGQDLPEVARAKKSTAGGLDGWAWNEIKSLPLVWLYSSTWWRLLLSGLRFAGCLYCHDS